MMLRFSALTMPELTDRPMPSGLPMANTGSPICTLSLSAQRTAVSGCLVSNLTRARSMRGEVARTRPGTRVPSENVTWMS